MIDNGGDDSDTDGIDGCADGTSGTDAAEEKDGATATHSWHFSFSFSCS